LLYPIRVDRTRTTLRCGADRDTLAGSTRRRSGVTRKVGTIEPTAAQHRQLADEYEKLPEEQLGERLSGRRVRLEDDDGRFSRPPCSPVVQVLVDLAPALPQPFTLVARRGPAVHLAPDPPG
jgi:hypothetical protein